VSLELEEARQVITSMCRSPEQYAIVTEETWAKLAKTEKPVGESEAHDGVGVGISITPPDWDTRIRAIFAAPKDGSDLRLAKALVVVWQSEDAEARVDPDLLQEVERITGEHVFE